MEKRINMSQDDLEKDVNSLQSKVNEITKGLPVNVEPPPSSSNAPVDMVKTESGIQLLGGITLKRFFILLGGILVGITIIFVVWRPNFVLHHNNGEDDEEIDEDEEGGSVKKPINLKNLFIVSIIMTVVIISVYVGYSRWK